MAKAKAKVQVVDKWKKKRWHRILAPRMFNEQVIGETIAIEPAMLSQRTISMNLMHLTRDMKKQNMNLVFEISRVMGDTAYTDIKRFEINPSSIRRFVRRGKQRIDDSFVCMTSDNRKVRIKPLLITSCAVKGSITNSLRKRAREFLASRIRKTTSDVLVYDTVNHKLQKEIKDALKNTYPVKISEIRVLSFEKSGKKEAAAEVPAPTEEKQEEVKESKKAEKKTEAEPEKKEAAESPKEKKPAEKKAKKEAKKQEPDKESNE